MPADITQALRRRRARENVALRKRGGLFGELVRQLNQAHQRALGLDEPERPKLH